MNTEHLRKSDSKRVRRLKEKLAKVEKDKLKRIHEENDRVEREKAWLKSRNKTSRPPTSPGKPLSFYLKKNKSPVTVPFFDKKLKKQKRKSKNKRTKSKVVVIHKFQDPRQRLDFEVSIYGKDMKSWYREVYLSSQHWRHLRNQAFEKHGRNCHGCKRTGRLDVHHLRYRNIFDVTVDDLQILCRNCHELEHLAIES